MLFECMVISSVVQNTSAIEQWCVEARVLGLTFDLHVISYIHLHSIFIQMISLSIYVIEIQIIKYLFYTNLHIEGSNYLQSERNVGTYSQMLTSVSYMGASYSFLREKSKFVRYWFYIFPRICVEICLIIVNDMEKYF